MITIDPPSTLPIPIEPPLSKSALTRFLNRARNAVGLTGEVEILLTSDAELKRLNRTFRNKNKPTDILSFPTPPEISAHHAGDLAISLETAARQAAQFGHTLTDELRILILHGLLHLSSLDHETDSGQMAARESELRSQLKLPATLIARAATTQRTTNNGQRTTNNGQRTTNNEQRSSPKAARP
jgi:probable rRNA maturation factor